MVNIRIAEFSDLEKIFKWRNIDMIVTLSSSQKTVTHREHSQWFKKAINNPNIKILIIENNGLPVGQIRFEKKNKDNACDVSIYLIPGEQSKGIGSIAIVKGIAFIKKQWKKIESINANIRKENKKSKLFFERNFFVKTDHSDQQINYSFSISDNIDNLIKRNKEFYDFRVEVYGKSYKSLNWGSQESQENRFEVLSKIGNLTNARILDFGCGIGDLYEWFLKKDYKINYTGIDISTKMIENASKRFPKAKFIEKNIFNDPLDQKFDYILLSGVFAYTNQFFFQECIGNLYENCNKAIGFNLLSKWEGTQKVDKEEFIKSPENVLTFCKNLTTKIILRHDYHPRDFTVFLYK